MIKLNLLPWRMDARKRDNQFYYMQLSISVFVGCLILSTFYGCLTIAAYRAQDLNLALALEKEKLKTPLAILHTLTEDKKKLNIHVSLLQALETDRVLVLKLLDTLPRVLPAFVSLRMVTRKNSEIVLEGYAHTNSGIALLMKNLTSEQNNIQFADVHLATITKDRKDAHLRFKISLTLIEENHDATVIE